VSVRVGIDLVDVDQVASAISAHGDRYLRRVYTAAEVADCGGTGAPRPDGLAARFAAKEAAFKALGAEVLPFHEIEVVRGPGGAPALVLHGSLARHAAALGDPRLQVSLAHERGIAAAIVAITHSSQGVGDDR
jgi:holo-[acyl-carrier protein] synthase